VYDLPFSAYVEQDVWTYVLASASSVVQSVEARYLTYGASSKQDVGASGLTYVLEISSLGELSS
jgi:hypothetical protein